MTQQREGDFEREGDHKLQKLCGVTSIISSQVRFGLGLVRVSFD